MLITAVVVTTGMKKSVRKTGASRIARSLSRIAMKRETMSSAGVVTRANQIECHIADQK
jgi:hypothetical protein